MDCQLPLFASDEAKQIRPKPETTSTHSSSPSVKELPHTERPVERLHSLGPLSLSTTELLAIVLGTPNQLNDAYQMYAQAGSLLELARASNVELAMQPGLGKATVARVKAALELGRRLTQDRDHAERPQVRSPADAANLVMSEMMLLEQEEMRVVLLGTKNHVLSIPTVYRGSVNTTLIRVSELFREAVRCQAPSIILVHNHPSGDPTPSPEDVMVTKQVVQAGNLMDIDVMDHIIIGRNRFVSLKERGLGWS